MDIDSFDCLGSSIYSSYTNSTMPVQEKSSDDTGAVANYALCKETEIMLGSVLASSSAATNDPIMDYVRKNLPTEGVLRFDTRTGCANGLCHYPQLYLELPKGTVDAVGKIVEMIEYPRYIYADWWTNERGERGIIDVTHWAEIRGSSLKNFQERLEPYIDQKVTFTYESFILDDDEPLTAQSAYILVVKSPEIDHIRSLIGLPKSAHFITVAVCRND